MCVYVCACVCLDGRGGIWVNPLRSNDKYPSLLSPCLLALIIMILIHYTIKTRYKTRVSLAITNFYLFNSKYCLLCL